MLACALASTASGRIFLRSVALRTARRGLERLGTSSLSAYAVHQLALSRQQPVLGWGAYWAAAAGLLAFTYVAVLGVARAEAAWARRRAATAS